MSKYNYVIKLLIVCSARENAIKLIIKFTTLRCIQMKNNKKGFTLVELVIVIAVIAILSAVLIPTFSNVINDAKISAAEQEAANLRTQILVENMDTFDAFCEENASECDSLVENNVLTIGNYSIELKAVDGNNDNFVIAKDGDVWTIAYVTESGYVVEITSDSISIVSGNTVPTYTAS